jgi:hypothetical protein
MLFNKNIITNKPNICFIIPDKPWYLNENLLITKQSNIEQIFINGFENALLISSIMICYSVISGNPSLFVNKLNRLSSKLMNFNNFYFQSALTSSIISLFLGINSALGFPNIDKKINK